jgi:hypothetical protein
LSIYCKAIVKILNTDITGRSKSLRNQQSGSPEFNSVLIYELFVLIRFEGLCEFRDLGRCNTVYREWHFSSKVLVYSLFVLSAEC